MRRIKRIVLLLIFCLFFIFPPKALAEPSVIVVSCPGTATITQSFQVEVGLSSLEAGEKYFVKSVGGKDWYDVKTWNEASGTWLSLNSPWEEMPFVNASAEGTANLSLSSMFVEGTSLGDNLYKIRIRKEGSTTNYDSSPRTISVLAAPTPTPTATPEPTAAPTSLPPTATPTPRPLTATSKPPTIKPTATPSEEGTVLEESSSPTITTAQELAKKEGKAFSFLPVIFIFLGAALIGGSLYLFWRSRQVSDFPKS
jgi:hypothetical protein